MAIITGCYESQVTDALLPKVNNCRHRNFTDNHKMPIPRGGKCMSTTTHILVYLNPNICCGDLMQHAN